MHGTLNNVDLRLLRVFKTVVECGGFSAAEAELNIQRSTISTHMADLESRLGYRLCQRGRAGFALTEAGRTVYEALLQLFASMDLFNEHVENAAADVAGNLAVGVVDNTITDARAGIVPALAALKSRAPAVQINLQVSSPTDIERELLNGRLHVGVAPYIHPLPGLVYHRLYCERNSLYCAQGHALFASATGALDKQSVLGSDYVARGYEGGVEIKTRHLPFKVMGTARSMEGAATLILTGKYIGYLPAHYARYWVERGLMRELLSEDASFDIEFNVVTRRGAQQSRSLDYFLDELFRRHAAVAGGPE